MVQIPPGALPLDSPRWSALKAHFDNAFADTDVPAVPKLLALWHRAVGSYDEEYEYEALYESYLHQRTILDVAYAVVPHLAARLDELDPDRRLSVLDDLALVDATRLTPAKRVEAAVKAIGREIADEALRAHMIQACRDRHPPLPADLSAAYLEAIRHARRLAGKTWGRSRSDASGPHHHRRHVRYLRDAGISDADIATGFAVLTREVDGFALVHRGHREALEGLVRDVPRAWLARTGITESGGRAFDALHSLAQLHFHYDIETMLA